MSRTSLVFTRISPRLHFFSFLSVISNSHYIFAILSSFCVQKDSRLCFCHFLFFLISSDFAYLYFFHCILIFHVHFLIYFSAFIFCLLFVNLVFLFFFFLTYIWIFMFLSRHKCLLLLLFLFHVLSYSLRHFFYLHILLQIDISFSFYVSGPSVHSSTPPFSRSPSLRKFSQHPLVNHFHLFLFQFCQLNAMFYSFYCYPFPFILYCLWFFIHALFLT